jgi:hypothetical protein
MRSYSCQSGFVGHTFGADVFSLRDGRPLEGNKTIWSHAPTSYRSTERAATAGHSPLGSRYAKIVGCVDALFSSYLPLHSQGTLHASANLQQARLRWAVSLDRNPCRVKADRRTQPGRTHSAGCAGRYGNPSILTGWIPPSGQISKALFLPEPSCAFVGS